MPGKGIKRKQGLGHDAVDQFAKATVPPKEVGKKLRPDQRRRMADLEQARKVLKEAPDTTSVAAMKAARADSDAESGSSPMGSSRDCGSASSDDTDERKARPTPSSDNEVDDSGAESGSSPVRPFFDPRRATDTESSDSEACDCEEVTECGGCGESYPDSEWVTMQAAPGICTQHPAWCGHCVDQACSLDVECSPLGGGGPTTCSCGFDAQNWDEQLAPCFGCYAICHSHCQDNVTDEDRDQTRLYICNGCDGTVADRCACCDQLIILADDNGELDLLEYGYTCEECVAVIKEKVRAMSN